MDRAVANTTKMVQNPHPFYPLEANIVGYLANQYSTLTLLGIFAAGCVGILGTTHLLVGRFNPRLSNGEKAAILWFILSGTIHFFFEGYFAWNHMHMPSRGDLFGQWWKEYAHADSRYLTSDPFVLCMESVTAVCWGPLCFVVALMITAEHPLRHSFQAMVSLGQIYGDILYYATSLFDHYYTGNVYWRPEAFYFWGYYVFLNFIWIVVPGYLLYQSFDASQRAFKALDRESKSQQGNGYVKKAN